MIFAVFVGENDTSRDGEMWGTFYMFCISLQVGEGSLKFAGFVLGKTRSIGRDQMVSNIVVIVHLYTVCGQIHGVTSLARFLNRKLCQKSSPPMPHYLPLRPTLYFSGLLIIGQELCKDAVKWKLSGVDCKISRTDKNYRL